MTRDDFQWDLKPYPSLKAALNHWAEHTGSDECLTELRELIGALLDDQANWCDAQAAVSNGSSPAVRKIASELRFRASDFRERR